MPLHEGLSVDAMSGVIAGTPTAAGPLFVTISASNAGGTDYQTLMLNIDP